ncbi:hypothetical protein GQX74_002521 [Glossina fuscipes]|nr:hypothetical protein GQX74_002521 [Glossina fuscipes]
MVPNGVPGFSSSPAILAMSPTNKRSVEHRLANTEVNNRVEIRIIKSHEKTNSMATDVNTLPRFYSDDARETFLSTAKIQLKSSSLSGTNLNLPYEWHTTVLTPPSSPVPIEVEESTRLTFKEQLHDAYLKKCTDVLDADASNDLKTNLDKFMSSERYHSQCLHQQKQQEQEQQRKQQQGEIDKV